MYFLWRVAHAPFGRTLQALRDNEQRVLSLGYNPFRLKLTAFIVMAAALGYAGFLLASCCAAPMPTISAGSTPAMPC